MKLIQVKAYIICDMHTLIQFTDLQLNGQIICFDVNKNKNIFLKISRCDIGVYGVLNVDGYRKFICLPTGNSPQETFE